MKIPQSFRKALASAFYDKRVSICGYAQSTDDFGAVTRNGFSTIRTVRASIQPASSAVMLEEFGQDLDATKRVACDLREGDVDETENALCIDGIYYDIKGILPTDTSLIIMAKEKTR